MTKVMATTGGLSVNENHFIFVIGINPYIASLSGIGDDCLNLLNY